MSEPNPNITIRKMALADLEEVIGIHIEQFPDSRSTSLGRIYLRKMYRWFVEMQPELSLVAVDSGQIVGFAVGSIGGYGRKIFRYAIVEIVVGLALHPRLVFQKKTYQLWKSFLKGFLPAQTKTPNKSIDTAAEATGLRASLCSIAVSRKAQGRGLGKMLLHTLEDAFRRLGMSQIVLSVQSDNLLARRLYESCQWEIKGDSTELGSTSYKKRLIG